MRWLSFGPVVQVLIVFLLARPAFGQGSGTQMPMPPGHDHQMMSMPDNPLGIDHTRDGSGTSWQPDTSPMQGLMRQRGRWMLMLHGNGFIQYIEAGSTRGERQFGSINWIMPMAQRPLGGGQLSLRTMFSVEAATVGRCGYPTLLASGETCRGEPLHDKQHPHDVFMELAAHYRHSLGSSVAFELYGGLAGEPALGPTAFPHRLSALPNPIAPVSHHWLDATHISFGVVSGGLYSRKWKAEGSLFNGREPDDRRHNLDMAALDSYSGRIWLMPTSQWAIQVSAGHLEEAEVHDDGSREDVNRVTASATYHRLVNSRLWATTVAWGRNSEHEESTPAFLVETAVDVTVRDVLFARTEVMRKTAADLVLPIESDEPFTLTKMQLGYTRWLAEGHGVKAGVGGSVGLSLVPETFREFYGGSKLGEAAVYFTIQPN